ncbi:hypothetical protein CsSME_00010071 [Camellia sinensis var. sinensis]
MDCAVSAISSFAFLCLFLVFFGYFRPLVMPKLSSDSAMP